MRDVKMAYAVAIERTDGVKSLVPRQFLAGFVTGSLILETAHCTANKSRSWAHARANANAKRVHLNRDTRNPRFIQRSFVSGIVPLAIPQIESRGRTLRRTIRRTVSDFRLTIRAARSGVTAQASVNVMAARLLMKFKATRVDNRMLLVREKNRCH